MITTDGIVLSTVRYSDSSVIAKIYTEQSGLGSFMVRTGNGKKALTKLALLQPLSLVELSYKNDDRKGIHSPRSLERSAILSAIPFDTVKTCVALFMAEIISRSIHEEEKNQRLFLFLKDAILMLDETEESCSNFHLKFMVEFSSHLGFYPSLFNDQYYFDLYEGEFVNAQPIHAHYTEGQSTVKLAEIISISMPEFHTVQMSSVIRRILLQKLIDFFRLHLDGMKELRSHKVLEEVLA
jgi:DNA repair protein RecO (recombination protein O)